MGVWLVTADALAASRFVTSPLIETVNALGALAARDPSRGRVLPGEPPRRRRGRRVRLPHPALGEELAVVVCLTGASTAGADGLRALAAGRLAAFKVPAHVYLSRRPLPRTASGFPCAARSG
jgi:hypothetical protein